jgi:hypothetical protein
VIGNEDASRDIKSDRDIQERPLQATENALARSAVATDATDAIFDLMREEQDRVLPLVEKADAPTAAGMRRSLLQTYSFAQQRRLVEIPVPRGGGYDGSIQIKGGAGPAGAAAHGHKQTDPSIGNIRLLRKSHNLLKAEQRLGRTFMAKFRKDCPAERNTS